MNDPKRTSNPPSDDFWADARESAKNVQAGPAWMRAGITLNETHFTTFGTERRTPTVIKK